MKFSFEGSFDELHELGLLLSKSKSAEVPVVVDSQEVVKADLQMALTDEPQMDISESIAKDPCIDPTTGEYFTGFKDMMAACDQLISNGQQNDAIALIKENSANGAYDGIPPKRWKIVEDEAKGLLKRSKKESTVTLSQLKELATEFTHSDPKTNKPKLKALLEKYNVKAISTIPEDKRSSFYDELNALNKGA